MTKNKTKLFSVLKQIITIIPLLGVICGVIIWFYNRELSIKDVQIDQMRMFQFDNVNSMIEAQKKLYSEQLANLEYKIKMLESSKGQNSEQIKIYKQQVIELQTKINVIKDISNEVVKAAEAKLGPSIKFTEIIPFSFYKFPDEQNSYTDSLFGNFLEIMESEYYEERIKYSRYHNHWSRFYLLHGQHSPIFYSFDSVDLRTATFTNADLRGVDLTKSIIDSKTKLPHKNK
jgi:hypothetical protein